MPGNSVSTSKRIVRSTAARSLGQAFGASAAALAFAASSAAFAVSWASISSHFFMYFLKIAAQCSDALAPTLCQYLMRLGTQRDARFLVRDVRIVGAQLLDRPCRRAAGGRRWRRCGNSAGASGPSASCECERPRRIPLNPMFRREIYDSGVTRK